MSFDSDSTNVTPRRRFLSQLALTVTGNAEFTRQFGALQHT